MTFMNAISKHSSLASATRRHLARRSGVIKRGNLFALLAKAKKGDLAWTDMASGALLHGNDRIGRSGVIRLGVLSLGAVVALICGSLTCVSDAWATATPITLGTATGYGLLTGVNETTVIGGAFKLTGNLGLAAGYNVKISGANSQSGTTYYDGSGSGGQWSDSGTYTTAGSVNQSMSGAVSSAITASSNAGALAATAGLSIQGSGSTYVLSAVTNLSENVLDISSVSLTNGTFTFNDNGYTGAKYIINVTGAFSLSNVTMQLQGGATAADIIFNIEGTGQTVSITGGTTLGTILVPNSNVTVGGGGSLTGELIAGANSAGKGYTVTEQSSGYNITSFAYVPRSAKVAEPSSLALLGAGLTALAVFGQKKHGKHTGARRGLTIG